MCPAGLIKLFNRNEDMIATVVGHECAHAVARHSIEKLTLGLLIALSVQVRLHTATQLPSPHCIGVGKTPLNLEPQELFECLQSSFTTARPTCDSVPVYTVVRLVLAGFWHVLACLHCT